MSYNSKELARVEGEGFIYLGQYFSKTLYVRQAQTAYLGKYTFDYIPNQTVLLEIRPADGKN